MVELVEAGELTPKTVNNARACLSVALNTAVRNGLMARNPCADAPALPVERNELDYLRLPEIDRYRDACATHYRPPAALPEGLDALRSIAVIRGSGQQAATAASLIQRYGAETVIHADDVRLAA